VASGGGEIASDGTKRHFGFSEVSLSSELRYKRFVRLKTEKLFEGKRKPVSSWFSNFK